MMKKARFIENKACYLHKLPIKPFVNVIIDDGELMRMGSIEWAIFEFIHF